MKSPLVFTPLLLSFSLGTLLVAPFARAQTPPGNTAAPNVAPYASETVDRFVQSCITDAVLQSPNIPVQIVNNYCRCVIAQVQTKLPEADFTDLNQILVSNLQAVRDKRPPSPLNERQNQSGATLNQSVQYCVNQQRTGNR
jgi:hypothetical protein